MPMMSNKVEIAKIGKVVGLSGELKLHLMTDFEEQFVQGATFTLKNNKTLIIESYNAKRGLVKFQGYSVREDAAVLTNQVLYLSEEESRANCQLEENQYFWFDMIEAKVMDSGRCLGVIKDIERIASTDYLKITTDEALVKEKLPKSFYIPYLVDVYIERFDTEAKVLYTKEAYPLLEAS
jgi:16S rRNA processing protein RimM